jgi:6-phosphogluconolactonase|tara:strand:- start:2187 stop:2849 length:663 start_codon:yes stop_codon:yes gene_type:complete
MNIVDFFVSYLDKANQAPSLNNIMLTGGNSAKELYVQVNRKYPLLREISNTNFYLTDERHVPFESIDSNQKIVEDHFLNEFNLSKESNFHKFNVKLKKPSLITSSYNEILPNQMDLILLSMGEDGHIASLFPNDNLALGEYNKKVLSVCGPKSPRNRFTITPRVIKDAKNIIVLCFGSMKRLKYEEALVEPNNFLEIPARLVLDRTWVFSIDQNIDTFKK